MTNAFQTFGQSAFHTTTVSASPAPTRTVFTVGSVGSLRVGHYIWVTISGTPEQTAITDISGSQLTVSPALSIAPSSTNPVVCYADDLTNAKLNLGLIWDVASTAALSATSDTGMPNGTRAQVQDGPFYRLNTGSSATVDGYTVLSTLSGTGRWLIQSSGGLFQTITGATTANNAGKYITNHAGTRVPVTLPASPAVGAEPIEIVNAGAAGFSLTLNPGQHLNYTATQYTYGQQLQNSDVYAAIRLLCTAADTFTIINAQGSLSFSTTGAGYSMGGANNLSTMHNEIYKLTFSSEARSTLAATLDSSRGYGAGTQSTTKGYHCGGSEVVNVEINKIDDMNFSTDASAAISATLDTGRLNMGSVYSGSAGYLMGGTDSSTAKNTISKLTFSGETEANISATLTVSKSGVIGVSDTLAGYRIGGSVTTSINKLTYGTEVVSTIAATLADGLYVGASLQQKGNAGYAVGGVSDAGGGAVVSSAKKLTYSGETISTPSATLDTAKQLTSGCNSAIKGYILGGYTNAAAFTDVIEDWVFSADTSAALSAVLGAARAGVAGVSAFV